MEKPQQVYILKTYGGQEGPRVRAGTIFTIGEHMDSIRFNALKKSRIATEYDPELHGAGKPSGPLAKVEPDSSPPKGPITTESVRRQARAKVTNDTTPKEPRLIKGGKSLTGGPTGKAVRSSSSPVVPALDSAILRQRGSRRAPALSQSTQAGGSAPGRTSSTPVTAPGGAASTPKSSEAQGEVLD